MLKSKSLLRRIGGVAEPNDRRNDHRERIARISTIDRGIGQHGDDSFQQNEGPGVPVHHEQGKRRWAFARLMNEVQPLTLDVGQEMREPVEPFFLLLPVELFGPIMHQFLHVVQIDSATPAGSRNLVRPASSSQPFA